jgi:Glycosyltransferase family 87
VIRSYCVAVRRLTQTAKWALLVAAWLIYVGIYVRLGTLLVARPESNDFTILYYTARMLIDGRPMYGDLPSTYGLDWSQPSLGNLNAPHFQLLMLPFALLAYGPALIAWGALNLLLVVASLRAIVRELEIPLTVPRMLGGGIAVLASIPWLTVMMTGEMSLLLLYPFTRAWIAARRGHWATAGGWIGLLASLKPFFALFVVWLAIRASWRALLGGVAAAGAAVTLGATVFGIGVYFEWLRGFARIGWWSVPMNVSIRGLVERLFDPGSGMAPLWRAPALTQPLWTTAGIAVLVVTLWKVREDARAHDLDRTILLLLCAALLLSPLGWVYYLPLATGPVAAIISRGVLKRATASATLIILGLTLLYIPIEFTAMGQPTAWATLTLASTYSWAVLLCWAGLVIAERQWSERR